MSLPSRLNTQEKGLAHEAALPPPWDCNTTPHPPFLIGAYIAMHAPTCMMLKLGGPSAVPREESRAKGAKKFQALQLSIDKQQLQEPRTVSHPIEPVILPNLAVFQAHRTGRATRRGPVLSVVPSWDYHVLGLLRLLHVVVDYRPAFIYSPTHAPTFWLGKPERNINISNDLEALAS
ncbi:hypothetical protein B9Z19DRAFT_1125576 [Tuber borchii]|uniref:Uncharacterized protein n=1 Tax=Tuber borchii TaxID=42251 RepID=A0A2T6ZUP2_TUBBO|nr:hypothetical protein B9Z19DRAFT_1125576 [Tuber borchii]